MSPAPKKRYKVDEKNGRETAVPIFQFPRVELSLDKVACFYAPAREKGGGRRKKMRRNVNKFISMHLEAGTAELGSYIINSTHRV